MSAENKIYTIEEIQTLHALATLGMKGEKHLVAPFWIRYRALRRTWVERLGGYEHKNVGERCFTVNCGRDAEYIRDDGSWMNYYCEEHKHEKA